MLVLGPLFPGGTSPRRQIILFKKEGTERVTRVPVVLHGYMTAHRILPGSAAAFSRLTLPTVDRDYLNTIYY